ncbi:hypothetical protein [Methylocucumis oryzae]|uniref:Uncharacterized protein n=1 Tax=Methylocucumis oryzae TaxID=1632867 RepID=A0A0F3IM67_9GAMM|nr:hypothetical protein [Methylocucumis oryzae]KJV07772.1 hypothetical protein VZ94_02265 [Methylocucumis oryzae]
MKSKQYKIYAITALVATLALFSSQNSLAALKDTLDDTYVPLPDACANSTEMTEAKAIGRSTIYSPTRDYSGGIENGVYYPIGGFSPAPLFSTSFKTVSEPSSCVLVNLSVNAQPNDNAMVFQVRVDGKPMNGHWNSKDFFISLGYPIASSFNSPIIWLPNVVENGFFAGIDPPHMASFMFFASVGPGTHQVEVLTAGCCHQDIDTPAGKPDGIIRSATLTIQHGPSAERAAAAATLATRP